MVRGFSRLILPPDFSRLFFSPRFGVEEGRCGSKVKGHVKEGSHFGGMNLPGPGPRMILSAPAQRAGRGEGARGHAPFLEASRRSWKEGGAMNREERGVGTEGYKGAQDARFFGRVVVSPPR